MFTYMCILIWVLITFTSEKIRNLRYCQYFLKNYSLTCHVDCFGFSLCSVFRQWLLRTLSICKQWVKLLLWRSPFICQSKNVTNNWEDLKNEVAEICSDLLAAESIIHLMLSGYGGANRYQKSTGSYSAKIVQKSLLLQNS